jgi:RimJ/RimL family protein N-acetyltransferase
MQHIIVFKGLVGTSLGLLQEEYAAEFVPWANHRIDIEGTHVRPPYWPSNFVEWVRDLAKSKGIKEVFAILVPIKVDGQTAYRYVGHTGLHDVQWPQGFASTGSVIGAKDAQGRGVGTEAKLLLLYHAFKVVGLRKVVSSVKSFNVQSAAHLIKCGYKFVGLYRHHFPHDGKFVDSLLFEVFPEDWEPIWKAYQETKTLPKLTDEQKNFLKKELIDL